MEIHDTAGLIREMEEGFQPEWLFFWQPASAEDAPLQAGCLSQWAASPFEIDGVPYPTAEHFMMAEKARLFDNGSIADQIVATPDPGEVKALGRQVTGFDEATWIQHRLDIILRGNHAKFSQDARLRDYLVGTGGKVLVDANPEDTVWGIGLTENDPKATSPQEWNGLNLLGFALMTVRARLAR